MDDQQREGVSRSDAATAPTTARSTSRSSASTPAEKVSDDATAAQIPGERLDPRASVYETRSVSEDLSPEDGGESCDVGFGRCGECAACRREAALAWDDRVVAAGMVSGEDFDAELGDGFTPAELGAWLDGLEELRVELERRRLAHLEAGLVGEAPVVRRLCDELSGAAEVPAE